MRVSFVLLSLLFATPSFAQSIPASLPPETSSQQEAPQKQIEIEIEDLSNPTDSFQTLSIPKKKTPLKSFALSLGGAVAGPAMLLTGFRLFSLCKSVCPTVAVPMVLLGGATIVVGPSLGHFYSGANKRGALTSVGRGVAIGTASVSGAIFLSAAFFGGLGGLFPVGDRLLGDSITVIKVSAVVWAGITLYDIIDSPFVPKRVEKRQKRKLKEYNLSLLPAPMRTPEGKTNLGLLFSGTF